jgi:uncharacterized pyridoxal phosphate-containing UPF0001 family protein
MNLMTRAHIERLENRIAELEREIAELKKDLYSWDRWGRLQENKRKEAEARLAKYDGRGTA